MFKSIRTTAGLAAIAAAAATAAAGVASPPAAEAAHCRQYAIPKSLQIEQANDWTVVTGKKLDAFEWQASAWPDPGLHAVRHPVPDALRHHPGPGDEAEGRVHTDAEERDRRHLQGRDRQRALHRRHDPGQVQPRRQGRLLVDEPDAVRVATTFSIITRGRL